jgi:hypothetical protein
MNPDVISYGMFSELKKLKKIKQTSYFN